LVLAIGIWDLLDICSAHGLDARCYFICLTPRFSLLQLFTLGSVIRSLCGFGFLEIRLMGEEDDDHEAGDAHEEDKYVVAEAIFEPGPVRSIIVRVVRFMNTEVLK
jgi:hypothetical protein